MSESYWWCSNCKEEVDGRRVTFSEKHMDCGHYVECITPEEHGRIAELEAEVVSLKAAGRDYVELTLKQIKDLEAELASASEAFAKRDIERHNRIKELEAELAKTYSDIAGFTNQLLESQVRCQKLEAVLAKMKKALHDAEAIGDFSAELRDRLALKEAAQCVPILQAEVDRKSVV